MNEKESASNVCISLKIFFTHYLLYFLHLLYTTMNNKEIPLKVPHEEVALLSIDNTQWFENKSLNELYVREWEMASKATKEIVDLCKRFWIQIINVFDNHPYGHVLFAANYKDKMPYDLISFDEVNNRTEQDNWIWERAGFSLQELKAHLSWVWSEVLWPDHCIQWTQWASLMSPLSNSDFDINIPKWETIVSSWYSWFDHTNLDEILKKWNKKVLLLSGVATDYCVWQTAIDAKNLWYEPILLAGAVRGVAPETTVDMVSKLKSLWIQIMTKEGLLKLLKFD